MKQLKVMIVHNQLGVNAKADEADVMDQVYVVRDSLLQLGHKVEVLPLSLNLEKAWTEISRWKPDVVFNLVESFENRGELVYLAPALFDALHIPYTGTLTEAMFRAANKTMTKESLSKHGLPTPEFYELNQLDQLQAGVAYILKPRWEEGSLGLEEDSVFYGDDTAFIQKLALLKPKDYFIESFIQGREFNAAIVMTPESPRVLAVAEIEFVDYPADKPTVLGYRAKWEEQSFEYQHTRRRLDFEPHDHAILNRLAQLSLDCWKTCNLKGYARVDFRVDHKGNPYILEVNANPCISPDSGFFAAVKHAGLDFTQIVDWVVADALIDR